MKDSRVGYPDERTAQSVIGEPLRQLTSQKTLHQVLLERNMQYEGVAFHQHQARQPESVIERQGDATEACDRQAQGRPHAGNEPVPIPWRLREWNQAHGRPGFFRLGQRANAIIARQITHPRSEAPAPALKSGVSYRNVMAWTPAGTTTARTSALARMIGSSRLFSSFEVQPLSKASSRMRTVGCGVSTRTLTSSGA